MQYKIGTITSDLQIKLGAVFEPISHAMNNKTYFVCTKGSFGLQHILKNGWQHTLKNGFKYFSYKGFKYFSYSGFNISFVFSHICSK